MSTVIFETEKAISYFDLAGAQDSLTRYFPNQLIRKVKRKSRKWIKRRSTTQVGISIS